MWKQVLLDLGQQSRVANLSFLVQLGKLCLSIYLTGKSDLLDVSIYDQHSKLACLRREISHGEF
jgi:hypothetical protein